MLTFLLSFLQRPVEFSVLGCFQAAFLAVILYYIYAKTRTLAILAGFFSNIPFNKRLQWKLQNTKANNELLLETKTNNKDSLREHNFSHGIGTRNLLEITPHAGRKPYLSFRDWGVYCPHLAQTLRYKKFAFPQVLPLVKKDAILQRAIKQAAEQIYREQHTRNVQECEEPIFNGNNKTNAANKMETDNYQHILQQQERRAVNILKEMRSTINNWLLACTSWLLYKLIPCFLTGVVTHTQQIEMLKAATEKAPGVPLIFLPLHRSHLDYIMVSFILTNNDIRSPLVAAGNNLQLPILGWLLRGLGAFFIKRKIDPVVGKKDTLYRTILHLYLQHALKLGHNVEFFIEGGRTRTGKPCMPKGGILSVIVNAFMDRSIPDALLVPISVNYDRLVDGNFVCEQKGEKKVQETFGKAVSGIWKALNSNYGLMRIDFNEPYSIKELVQSYNKIAIEEGSVKVRKPSARTLQHNQSTSSLYGTDVVCEEHRNLIESISRQIVYDCAAATSVMSTNALAFLLLTRYRSGATLSELANALDDLRETLKGRKDLGFSGNSKHIINYAAELLGETLIERTANDTNEVMLRVADGIDSWIELAYYANTLTPHFALKSIVLTTFYHLINATNRSSSYFNDFYETLKNDKEAGVSRKKLIEAAIDNCEVYRYEYILHKPTQTLEQVLDATIDELIIQDFMKTLETDIEPDSVLESRRIAHSLANYLDDEDNDYRPYSDNEVNNMLNMEEKEIFFVSETIERQRALCEVLAPYSYAYLCVAGSLYKLYKNPMLESDFIQLVIKELMNEVQTQKCCYAESISTDCVKNCLKVLEKWSVIEISNQCDLRLLTLGALYETSRDSLKNVLQRISNIVPPYN